MTLTPSALRLLVLVGLVGVGGGCDAGGTEGGDAGADAEVDGEARRTDPSPPRWTCPDGWAPTERDGVSVCDPGPSLECPPGQAQFVGSASCEPVGGPCPAGDFAGDLPSAGVRYVRPGGSGDGSRDAPFGSIAEAMNSAPAGTTVALAKGTYEERITLATGVQVRGACAAETRLMGRGTGGAAILVPPSVSDSGVRGLSVRSVNQVGVVVEGDVTLRDVAIEDAQLFGVVVLSGSLVAETLLVRDTKLGPSGDNGFGLAVVDGSAAELRSVVLESNHQVGLAATTGATVQVEDLAARSQRVGAVPDFAAGVFAQGARITGRRVWVEDTRGVGVYAAGGGGLELDEVLVRRSRAEGANMGFGVGVVEESTAVLSRAWVTDAQGTAVQATGGTMTLRDVVVDAVVPPPERPDWALGVGVNAGGRADLERVWIADTAAAGLSVFGDDSEPVPRVVGTDLTVRGVRDLGLTGVGIYLARAADGELRRVAVQDTSHAGIVVTHSSLRMFDLLVRDTAFNAADGLWGRGIETIDAELTLERAEFEGQHEVAVVVSRGQATIRDLEVRRVSARGCAATSCSDAPGGMGLSVVDGARVTIDGFVIEDAPLCGVQLARSAELDLHDGWIRSAAVGACVQVEGYDLTRLTDSVRFEQTGTRIQSTSHHVPEVHDPLS